MTFSVIFVTIDNRILFLRRAAHKSFAGKYLGIGGKYESGEDLIDGAKRETLEESGLDVDPIRFGQCDYYKKNKHLFTCHYFKANLNPEQDFDPKFKFCEEGELLWVDKESIFMLNMPNMQRQVLQEWKSNNFSSRFFRMLIKE